MKTTPNAHMWQKSLIQQIMEQNASIENFKNTLNNLMESYTINGNVFGCKNGQPVEVHSGYFVVECEKNNLQEAIREINDSSQYIRIIENKIFQVGNISQYFSNCDSDKVIIDIETQSIID